MRQKARAPKPSAETVIEDPPRHPKAVWNGREDPRRAGRSARRGIDRRAMPARRDCREPLLQLVEGIPEAGKKRLAGDTARGATTDEVKQLRRETRQGDLAEQALDCDCSKSMIRLPR